MTQEATQRPWDIDDVTALAREITIYGPPGIGAKAICVIPGNFLGSKDERRANAALIVRAVNHHEALLAALETARLGIEELCIGQHPENAAGTRSRGRARAGCDCPTCDLSRALKAIAKSEV